MEKPSGHQVPYRVWVYGPREASMAAHALWVAGFRVAVACLSGASLTISGAVARAPTTQLGDLSLVSPWARSETVNERLASPGAGTP